jgi:hypothetical protein
MKLSLYTMRPMQAVRRLKSIHAFNTVTPKPSNNRQSPQERKPTAVLQIEFPTAMTYEELDKRAGRISAKLRVWQVQSDIALQHKQREANRAELQAVVQRQLRAHSGTLNSRSPPPPPSTNHLQRPDGMKYMTARQKRDMVKAQLHRMLICVGINV